MQLKTSLATDDLLIHCQTCDPFFLGVNYSFKMMQSGIQGLCCLDQGKTDVGVFTHPKGKLNLKCCECLDVM
jgi:hypothetical protein